MEIHILWGGPGQGKSTYIAEQLGLWAAKGTIDLARTLVLGPTGVACVSLADSLARLPGRRPEIMTLARFALLARNLPAATTYDAVVIDEFWACTSDNLMQARRTLDAHMAPKTFCLILAGDPMQLSPPDSSQTRLHIEWVSALYSAHPKDMRIVRLASVIPPRFSRASAALPPGLAPHVDVRAVDALAWATLIDDLWHARPADPGVARALATLWTHEVPTRGFTLTATIAAARVYNTACVHAESGIDPEYLYGSCPRTLLGLAPGMPVIVRRNLNIARRWVNGTPARISRLIGDDCALLVRDDGETIGAVPLPRFERPAENEYPFSLGFASTVHSLQGCTMTEPFVVDESILRAAHTPYTLFLVAASRAVCPSLLRIRGASAGEVERFLLRDHIAARRAPASTAGRELLERLGAGQVADPPSANTLRHSKIHAVHVNGAGERRTSAQAYAIQRKRPRDA